MDDKYLFSAYVDGTFTINERTPTLTVTNSPLSYNGSPRGAVIRASVPGKVSNVLIGGSTTQTNAGVYPVTADFIPDDTTNNNSLVGVSAGNLVIEKVTPILSVTNSPTQYDGSTHAPIIVSSVAGTVSNILVGGAAVQKDPGAYTVTANFTPTDSINYHSLVDAPAGNFVIKIDITPPGTQILFHPTSPSSRDVTFVFSSEDDTATFECQLDDGGFSTCTSPLNYIDLEDGSHTFTVRAIDPFENVDPTPASHTWTVNGNRTYYMMSKVVPPFALTTQGGASNGPVTRLWYLEQSGVDNNADAYVDAQTPAGVYLGYHSFYFPDDIPTDLIYGALLQVNFNGPATSEQIWTWSIYDWNKGMWIKLGDSIGSSANEWNSMVFPLRNIRRIVSANREVRIQLRSSNASNDLKVDYEAIHLTYYIPRVVSPTLPAPPTPASRPSIALQTRVR
jgi:hypothetical protein